MTDLGLWFSLAETELLVGHQSVGSFARGTIVDEDLVDVLGLVEVALAGKIAQRSVGQLLHVSIGVVALL